MELIYSKIIVNSIIKTTKSYEVYEADIPWWLPFFAGKTTWKVKSDDLKTQR